MIPAGDDVTAYFVAVHTMRSDDAPIRRPATPHSSDWPGASQPPCKQGQP